jgi:uncharacterized protein (DUF1684 family)
VNPKKYSLAKSRKVWALILCASFALAVACNRSTHKIDEASYRQEIEKWHAERAAELKSEDGWLTLAGLFWLKEGENKIGSDASNQIVLPQGKAPPIAGSLWLDKGSVRLESLPGSGITHEGQPAGSLALQTDADGKPTTLNLGTLSFYVIKRGESLGVRVKDKENAARTNFLGLEYYPVNPVWRVEAKLQPYDPPKPVSITNVLGMVEDMTSPGALFFDVAGNSYRLDAVVENGSKELFIIFADQTSGRETYGAGRYLYANPPDAQGTVIVDFNKAYNPPCAFTNYATCPLPPPQNRLPLRIEAGEKSYAGSKH